MYGNQTNVLPSTDKGSTTGFVRSRLCETWHQAGVAALMMATKLGYILCHRLRAQPGGHRRGDQLTTFSPTALNMHL